MAAAHYFQLLGLPPRAALNEEILDAAYLKATRGAHPDQEGGDAELSAELNAAVEALRSPVTRLRHLIETQSDMPWRAIPLDNAMMSLFSKMGPLLQEGNQFLKKKAAATTSLSKALLAGEEMRLREALEDLNGQIEEQWQGLEQRLPHYDDKIERGEVVWAEVQGEQARFAYLAKWRSQIRELLVGLML